MSTTISYTEVLVETNCWCGIHLAIPENLERHARQDHSFSIHCPLGHTFVYVGETEAQKERRLRRSAEDQLAAARAQRDQLEASLRTTRGHVTRLRKRAIIGTCAFCHRHFANVERHVASQHPGERADVEA